MRGNRFTIAAGLLAGLLLLSGTALAFESNSSTGEFWTELGCRIMLPNRVSVTFTGQFRFDEATSRHYLTGQELAARYKLLGWWHFGGSYRHTYERDNDAVFRDRHRFAANTRLSAKLSPIRFGLRLQWQKESRLDDDDGTPTRQLLRIRAKAKLEYEPGFTPYISLEVFQRLDDGDDDIPSGTIQKLRFGSGAEWQQGPLEINARYYWQLPTHDPEDPATHALSLSLRYDVALL